MKAPQNRKVFVVGYDAATALGNTFATTWQGAVDGLAGFRRLTRCETTSRANVVGEIPDWDPEQVILTLTVKRPLSGMLPMCF